MPMDDRKKERNPDDREDREEREESEQRGIFGRIVKRGIESSMGAISRSEDTLRGLVEGMKVPKEVAQSMLDQVDETKRGLYTVVAKEIREFLQSTNFAGDVKKILTGLAFEVKMEVRFKSVEDEGRTTVRPDVKADAALKPTRRRARDEERAKAPEPRAPEPKSEEPPKGE